eukprot:scaffold763_cov49-Attheya_sp.AAC.4
MQCGCRRVHHKHNCDVCRSLIVSNQLVLQIKYREGSVESEGLTRQSNSLPRLQYIRLFDKIKSLHGICLEDKCNDTVQFLYEIEHTCICGEVLVSFWFFGSIAGLIYLAHEQQQSQHNTSIAYFWCIPSASLGPPFFVGYKAPVA